MDNRFVKDLIELKSKDQHEYNRTLYRLYADGIITKEEKVRIRKEVSKAIIKKRCYRFVLSTGIVVVFASFFLCNKKTNEDYTNVPTIESQNDEDNVSITVTPVVLPDSYEKKAPEYAQDKRLLYGENQNIVKDGITPLVLRKNLSDYGFPSFSDYDFSLEARLKSNEMSENIGSKVDSEFLKRIEGLFDIFEKYGEMYGIDPYLILAKCARESNLNPNAVGGSSIGISQISEVLVGKNVTAYNYVTNEYDTELITDSKRKDIESSIRLGTMILQNVLKIYGDGNICLGIQAYNYGNGMMDAILEKYAKGRSITKEEAMKTLNMEDIYPIIEDAHFNPLKYIKKWHKETYGDKDYVKNVLRYKIGVITYYYCEESIYVVNLETGEVKVFDIEDVKKHTY